LDKYLANNGADYMGQYWIIFVHWIPSGKKQSVTFWLLFLIDMLFLFKLAKWTRVRD